MVETGNIPLKVPFKEKDEAKSLGARWNPADKHWYIPAGLDTTHFEKWMDTSQTIQALEVQPDNNMQKETLSESMEMDDINAMLREAYEVKEG